MSSTARLSIIGIALLAACTAQKKYSNDGAVLPFKPLPMAGVTRPRLQDSTMKWPKKVDRLPEDAPNILLVMLDDVGFGISDVFGGEVETPAFSKLAEEGIRYNCFHTTSICSPTRAALLTGRNHTRAASGTIAERAVAFDGYTGIIPKSAATIAEILKQYGYDTSAFGKWHNTPAIETSSIGRKDRWPTGYGFQYFYGFLGGETSQYQPRLTENYDHIEPPEHDPTYHLSQDLADRALHWLDDHQAFSPDTPFFMYWAPGGVHGPQQVFKEWADKYKGKFDDGWDAYRERVHKRQLEMGVIPAGTKLTQRDPTLAGWDEVPESQRAFQRRLMEIFAGFVQHTDHQVGRIVEGLEERGLRENTLIIYIFGDNGSSAEGQQGSISELLAQNGIPSTIDEQIEALDRIGGLPALGTEACDSMYHAGWAWAGNTPFKGTKLLGAYFGGTRNPMVISWPKGIKPDETVRNQFHHVVDIAPTLYDILDIPHPEVVNGQDQLPMDGISLEYTFSDGDAASRKKVQFFDNNASRAIYQDGWMACTFGPFIPWEASKTAGIRTWDSARDRWELYELGSDFSQSLDLAGVEPERLGNMKKAFLKLAADNQDFPIGAGLWLRIHPKDRVETPYSSWSFTQDIRRMPEFTAPGIGRESTTVVVEAEFGEKASGVLYVVGGSSGGLTVYMDEGHLVYEYNMLLLERFIGKSPKPIGAGKHRIEIDTDIQGTGEAGVASVLLDGNVIFKVELKRTVPLAFTATETFDVGIDLGSIVSPDYYERRPFEFKGKIHSVDIKLKE